MSPFLQNPLLVPEGQAVSFIDSESQVLQIFMRAVLISQAVSTLLDAISELLDLDLLDLDLLKALRVPRCCSLSALSLGNL